MCGDAQSSKLDELRVRDDNASADMKVPDHGSKKSKQFLFPSEVLRFVSCEEGTSAKRRTFGRASGRYFLRCRRWTIPGQVLAKWRKRPL
jgi:hypothetical protein